jgi:AraC-like DNA-binding protein/mannose-6-phosphate isomerase-like protein (cupin superfamily)
MNTEPEQILHSWDNNEHYMWDDVVQKLKYIKISMAHHYTARGTLFGKIHSHPDISHFCFIISGLSNISLNGKRNSVSSGQAIYFPPGVEHGSSDDKDTNFELIEIKFSFGQHSHRIKICDIPVIRSINNKASLMASLERFLETYLLSGSDNWLTKLQLLESLMIFFENDHTLVPQGIADIDLKIRQVVRHIHLNYAEPLSVESMADLISVSPSYFAIKFKQLLHVSPIEFLIRTRLQHAKELLQNSNLSVKQISEICGLSSPKYLARLFSHRFGTSPSLFKKKCHRAPFMPSSEA